MRPVQAVRTCGVLLAVFIGGCAREETVLRIWSHHGREAENAALRKLGAELEQTIAGRAKVELTFFPDFQYGEKLAVAAAAEDLPDVFDLDGPTVAKWAHSGLLARLDGFLDERARSDFLPTILDQGTIDGSLYALGGFESAVVLYYDRSMFARAAVDPPPDGDAWTWDQLVDSARKLKSIGAPPIALHMNETADEWYTYAFSPIIWSAGGRLIAEDGRTVAGVLDSDINVRALQRFRALFAEGLADESPVDPDPFASGRAAIDWTGHWMARGHLRAKGTQLGVMPLPKLGERSVAPSGSWCWAISARTRNRELAEAWLRQMVQPEKGIFAMVSANGAIPSRRSAFALFPELAAPPFVLFREQLETRARARPRTPHYAALTRHFAAALREIALGADVRPRLSRAALAIQAEIDRREKP
jgi:ABC-type glycerol-3-phosphate transport system substrate-binding protein